MPVNVNQLTLLPKAAGGFMHHHCRHYIILPVLLEPRPWLVLRFRDSNLALENQQRLDRAR